MIPYVIENDGKGERSYDIYSRLLKDRIVMLTDEIEDRMASAIVAQLLFLEAQDQGVHCSTTSLTFWRMVPPRLVRCLLGASCWETLHGKQKIFLRSPRSI